MGLITGEVIHLMSLEEQEDDDIEQEAAAASRVPCCYTLLPEEKTRANHSNSLGNRVGGRYPRWSRNETLLLIEAKRIEEEKWSRAKEAREKGIQIAMRMNSDSKWLSVSDYCGRMGAVRSAAQCRKRWCNLSADYKRIRDWQSLRDKQSFWIMSNDVRKENKLPGCFDHEVFDSLDKSLGIGVDIGNRWFFPGPEMIFDSGRNVVQDGIFSDIDHTTLINVDDGNVSGSCNINGEKDANGSPIIQSLASSQAHFEDKLFGERLQMEGCEECFEEETDILPGRKKRKRLPDEENDTFSKELCTLLETNSKILTSHIDSQNLNCRLDRAQRKEHTDSLVHVLGRLAHAFGKISEKL